MFAPLAFVRACVCTLTVKMINKGPSIPQEAGRRSARYTVRFRNVNLVFYAQSTSAVTSGQPQDRVERLLLLFYPVSLSDI